MKPPLPCFRPAQAAQLVAAALLVISFAAGCRKAPVAPVSTLPSAPVHILKVEPVTRPVHEEVVGTVRAKLRASIEPKVSARIEALLVAPGQMVKAGDLLARLDARELQARLDQSIALREQAVRELERSRTLLQQRISTQAEFDALQARERVASGALKEAEAMLGYTRVLAPFDGVITRKLADVGDLGAPGKPLAEMEDPAALRFEADVPESLSGRLALGARLSVQVGAATAPIDAVVVEIAPVADAASRTFLVKLDLPANPGLRSGQFGRVLVPRGETRSLQVPLAALTVRGQMETIFVVEKGHALLRLVRTGQRSGDQIELLAGLAAGESIVVEGAAALRDGQPVTLQP